MIEITSTRQFITYLFHFLLYRLLSFSNKANRPFSGRMFALRVDYVAGRSKGHHAATTSLRCECDVWDDH